MKTDERSYSSTRATSTNGRTGANEKRMADRGTNAQIKLRSGIVGRVRVRGYAVYCPVVTFALITKISIDNE